MIWKSHRERAVITNSARRHTTVRVAHRSNMHTNPVIQKTKNFYVPLVFNTKHHVALPVPNF